MFNAINLEYRNFCNDVYFEYLNLRSKLNENKSNKFDHMQEFLPINKIEAFIYASSKRGKHKVIVRFWIQK